VNRIFVSGGTGYIGRAVIAELLARGHQIKALSRPGSEHKVGSGAVVVVGNALDASTFSCEGCDTFIHLVGTPHPAPWKGSEFRRVDLPALAASVRTAADSGVTHFIFLSVAQPAPIMKAYISVRARGEHIIREAGLTATLLRPWYVLGPGHRWPAALAPLYWMAERIPAFRAGATRLGLVNLRQMIDAIVWSVENPPVRTRVVDVRDIRAMAELRATASALG
jgi:uncharacterized protein YbjT (DUF2867 family)